MAALVFEVDPIVSTLKAGRRPDCGGLVLVVGWSWGEDPSTHYEQLASSISALDPQAVHVYDPRHLHCTVATLSSFKNSDTLFFHASIADRDRIVQCWHQALQAAFVKGNSVKPFEVVFRSLEVSATATFLQADDDANRTMRAVRALVREAAEDSRLGQLSTELEEKYSDIPGLCPLKEALHVPDIIHSTVMRLASEPSDSRGLAKGLNGLQDRWEPATTKIDKIGLVVEGHPYMHLTDVDRALVHSYALPLC